MYVLNLKKRVIFCKSENTKSGRHAAQNTNVYSIMTGIVSKKKKKQFSTFALPENLPIFFKRCAGHSLKLIRPHPLDPNSKTFQVSIWTKFRECF